MRRAIRVLVVLVRAVSAAVFLAPSAESADTFRVGIPTVVGPVRGAGEPDIAVDNDGNALITGPGGSGSHFEVLRREAAGRQRKIGRQPGQLWSRRRYLAACARPVRARSRAAAGRGGCRLFVG